jgi:hypothetical protein
MNFKSLLSLLALVLISSSAFADQLLEQYVAVLSGQDHFNSNGDRLTDAAAIIRQDRANYHKYGKRDQGDSGDTYFASVRNRELLERMLNRGTISAGTIDAIVNGTPTILVRIFRSDFGQDYVNVSIVE